MSEVFKTVSFGIKNTVYSNRMPVEIESVKESLNSIAIHSFQIVFLKYQLKKYPLPSDSLSGDIIMIASSKKPDTPMCCSMSVNHPAVDLSRTALIH